MNPSRVDTELLKLHVAYLMSEGLKQAKIARQLGLSPSKVSRVVKSLEGAVYLAPVSLIPDKLSPMQREQIALFRRDPLFDQVLEQFVERGLAPAIPRYRVVPMPTREDGVVDWEKRSAEFAARAAAIAKGPLLAARVLGIAWGEVCERFLKHLNEWGISSGTARASIRIIPLCGEPPGRARQLSQSSTWLAQEFDRLLNRAHRDDPLSLTAVPVFIPTTISDREVPRAQHFLRCVSPSYAAIFDHGFGSANRRGKTQPLVTRLDTVLTGVSQTNNPFGFKQLDAAQASALGISKLRSLLVGDIAGVPLPRDDLTPSETGLLKALSKRWTGLRQEHLRACAQAALRRTRAKSATPGPYDAGGGPAGVIVLAPGKAKAPCLLKAIELGLVSYIIMDTQLRDAVMELMTERLKQTKQGGPNSPVRRRPGRSVPSEGSQGE